MSDQRIIDPKYRQQLLKLAKGHCKQAGISIGYLGKKIVNDGDFFTHLESGGDCRAETLLKVEQWLINNNAAQASA